MNQLIPGDKCVALLKELLQYNKDNKASKKQLLDITKIIEGLTSESFSAAPNLKKLEALIDTLLVQAKNKSLTKNSYDDLTSSRDILGHIQTISFR